jgi:hypothetical protein
MLPNNLLIYFIFLFSLSPNLSPLSDSQRHDGPPKKRGFNLRREFFSPRTRKISTRKTQNAVSKRKRRKQTQNAL